MYCSESLKFLLPRWAACQMKVLQFLGLGVPDGGCGSGFFVQISHRTNVEMKCGRLFVCLR